MTGQYFTVAITADVTTVIYINLSEKFRMDRIFGEPSVMLSDGNDIQEIHYVFNFLLYRFELRCILDVTVLYQ